jgi:hypothetical protein
MIAGELQTEQANSSRIDFYLAKLAPSIRLQCTTAEPRRCSEHAYSARRTPDKLQRSALKDFRPINPAEREISPVEPARRQRRVDGRAGDGPDAQAIFGFARCPAPISEDARVAQSVPPLAVPIYEPRTPRQVLPIHSEKGRTSFPAANGSAMLKCQIFIDQFFERFQHLCGRFRHLLFR